MKLLVYGLIDPISKMIRYVGKSTFGMTRPMQHRTVTTKLRTYCANWVRSLQAAGLDYEITVLEEPTDREALAAAERWWIAYGRASGWPLTNLTAGGDGGGAYGKRPPEVGRRISAARMGHEVSEETRRKIGDANRGRPQTPEERELRAERQRGKKMSDEARANNRASWTPERRAAMSERMRANNPAKTPEARAKISARFRGSRSSEAARASLRASWTPERRARHSSNRRRAPDGNS